MKEKPTLEKILGEVKGYARGDFTEEQYQHLALAVDACIKDTYSNGVDDALLNMSLGDDVSGIEGYAHVECEGGEGEGDYAYGVFLLHGNHYKFEYRYQSYDGFQPEYGTLTSVSPKQRTITVYE